MMTVQAARNVMKNVVLALRKAVPEAPPENPQEVREALQEGRLTVPVLTAVTAEEAVGEEDNSL